MLCNDHQLPALLPVLSRGKHRSPRKGACFMEFASLLAGERWSDHPACTHPLLAAVARHVNDFTSDAGRARLAELIPSVIGLTGEDLHIDGRIALGSARLALPVVAAERHASWRSRCCRANGSWPSWTADRWASWRSRAARPWPRFRTPPSGPLGSPALPRRRRSRPSAFASRLRRPSSATPPRASLRRVPDPDGMLRDLLVQAIDACAAWAGHDPDHGAALDPALWAVACRRTGGFPVADAAMPDALAQR